MSAALLALVPDSSAFFGPDSGTASSPGTSKVLFKLLLAQSHDVYIQGSMRLVAASIVFCVSAAFAQAAIEFNGYIRVSNGYQFVLTDTTEGVASKWLSLGGYWQGYTIVAFDRESETLVLERAGKKLQLPLNGAKVQEVTPGAASRVPVAIKLGPNGTLSQGGKTVTLADIEAIFRQYAEAGTPIHVSLLQPMDPTADDHKLTQEIHLALVRSGSKRWRFSIVDWIPEKK